MGAPAGVKQVWVTTGETAGGGVAAVGGCKPDGGRGLPSVVGVTPVFFTVTVEVLLAAAVPASVAGHDGGVADQREAGRIAAQCREAAVGRGGERVEPVLKPIVTGSYS